MIQGIIFDLDGTIYRGSQAVPGAADFVSRVAEQGIKVLFVTNRSNRTPESVCTQLRGYGISCTIENILTSAQATARHLRSGSVFFIGEEGLEQALIAAGLTMDPQSPDYVVVGFDRAINYTKIEKASRLIRAGARFIATNPDKAVNADGGISPGNGAIVAAIATASGVSPVVVGKPQRAIIDIALERMGLAPEHVILVGDNLETDIRAGINAGIRTVLILTGVSTRMDVMDSPVKADRVVEDYDELADVVFDTSEAIWQETSTRNPTRLPNHSQGPCPPSGQEYPDRPRVAVGAVIIHEGRVLLVKRGKPPSEGLWAIPGGSVELGETLQTAAEREILEETGIRIKAGDPVYTFDAIQKDHDGRVRFHYAIVDLLADYVEGEPNAGDDAHEVGWVRPHDLSALPMSRKTLDLLKHLRFLL
jgi:HAD superfamily hydrolase (TIGR01457 family)